MFDVGERLDFTDGIRDHLLHGYALVHEPIDEGRVGAIFE